MGIGDELFAAVLRVGEYHPRATCDLHGVAFLDSRVASAIADDELSGCHRGVQVTGVAVPASAVCRVDKRKLFRFVERLSGIQRNATEYSIIAEDDVGWEFTVESGSPDGQDPRSDVDGGVSDPGLGGHPSGGSRSVLEEAGVWNDRSGCGGSGVGPMAFGWEIGSGFADAFPGGWDWGETLVREAGSLWPDAGIQNADDDVVGIVGVRPQAGGFGEAEEEWGASGVDLVGAVGNDGEDGGVAPEGCGGVGGEGSGEAGGGVGVGVEKGGRVGEGFEDGVVPVVVGGELVWLVRVGNVDYESMAP
uniref:Uncharacterized protein n=1 Tax=Kalanchoe fedtschenkoi TaxID=63787 RepID=A0A7N0VA17_KALFE